MVACKKEATTFGKTAENSVVNRSQAATLLTLDLRPNADNGQDAYVEWKADQPQTATANFNYVPELPVLTWTDGGAVVKSATLYLYGLSSSLNHPPGNSGMNKCYVAQVTSPWDETTITWNTQPGYTTTGIASFGPSTAQWNWDTQADVTNIVKRMVKYPNKNYGFGIALQREQIYNAVIFGSSEAAENDRPRLVVEYLL